MNKLKIICLGYLYFGFKNNFCTNCFLAQLFRELNVLNNDEKMYTFASQK